MSFHKSNNLAIFEQSWYFLLDKLHCLLNLFLFDQVDDFKFLIEQKLLVLIKRLLVLLFLFFFDYVFYIRVQNTLRFLIVRDIRDILKEGFLPFRL